MWQQLSGPAVQFVCKRQRAGVQDADTAVVGVFHHSRRLSLPSVVWGRLLGCAVTRGSSACVLFDSFIMSVVS